MRKTLTDDEFFDALTNLLLAEGIKCLSVGEIASRMRCSRRRLYNIAQMKEEIFCATVERFFHSLLDEGEALIRSEQNLVAAISAYLGVGVRAGSRISIQFLKEVDDSEPARTIFDNYQQARTMRLSQLIDEGVRQGVFVACHGLVVSELILGAALRLRRPAFLAQANLTIEEAFQEFYRVLLDGLLADATAPKTVQCDDQTNRGIARRAQQAASEKQKRQDVGNDDVARMLMAAWNRG
jgi:AcrR family transcriptional regulator